MNICKGLSFQVNYIIFIALSHQQFRINMTQDYDMLNVAQDNPLLIAYIRQLHMSGGSNAPHLGGASSDWSVRNENSSGTTETDLSLADDARKSEGNNLHDRIIYIVNLLNNKVNEVLYY